VRDGRSGRGDIADLPSHTTVPPPMATAPSPPATTTAGTSVSTPAPAAPSATVEPVTAEEVVVVDGDNLWTIAAARLARSSGRSPADVPEAEIAQYWIRVCDANRARLASGDPNLIVPGEHVVLPPVH